MREGRVGLFVWDLYGPSNMVSLLTTRATNVGLICRVHGPNNMVSNPNQKQQKSRKRPIMILKCGTNWALSIELIGGCYYLVFRIRRQSGSKFKKKIADSIFCEWT